MPLGWAGPSPLEYRMVKGSAFEDPLISKAVIYLQPSLGRPAAVRGKPSGTSGEIRYFLGYAGKRQVVVAMDSASPVNLYMARDGGMDLTEAKLLPRTKVAGKAATIGVDYQYGPAVLASEKAPKAAATKAVAADELAVDEARTPVLIASLHDAALAMYPAGYMAGEVKAGGHPYKVALIDRNFDGAYLVAGAGDQYRTSDEGDLLAIDLNGDGQFEQSSEASFPEIRSLERMLTIEEAFYEMKVARNGSTIELVAAKSETGTLAVNRPGVELMISGDVGKQFLAGNKTKWEIPAGHYMCQMIRLTAKDADGNMWVLQAFGDTGKLQSFDIKAGEELALELGPPLNLDVDVQQQSAGWIVRGKEMAVGFQIVGQAGERYSPGAMKNGQQVPAPKIKIYDEKGEVLASGDFQYG
ncbi:MAG TPA: hypothetical protein VHP11_10715 [Tepidisphaeraceae bacterium]|nr:hypothetical protein [Tepidisphaeraceae bacterium]